MTAYVDQVEFVTHTKHTVTSRKRLEEILIQVRTEGYALNDQELEIGLRSIAVPVRNVVGSVVAAMNVAVFCSRPHGFDLYPEWSATACITCGCRDCRSSARTPPTNIDASPCTRPIGLSGSNQRGPGVLWIWSRAASASGPATRLSRAWARAARGCARRLTG